MKKHSYKLLQFLQTENSKTNIEDDDKIQDIEVISELGKGGQSKVFEVVIKRQQR